MDSSESPVHGQQEGSAYNGRVGLLPLFRSLITVTAWGEAATGQGAGMAVNPEIPTRASAWPLASLMEESMRIWSGDRGAVGFSLVERTSVSVPARRLHRDESPLQNRVRVRRPEQLIKEGKQAAHWTRRGLAYSRVDTWSLTSLQRPRDGHRSTKRIGPCRCRRLAVVEKEDRSLDECPGSPGFSPKTSARAE